MLIEIKLLTFATLYEAPTVLAALEKAGIPAYQKGDTPGLPGIGSNEYGVDIFVSENDLEQAVQIVNGLGYKTDFDTDANELGLDVENEICLEPEGEDYCADEDEQFPEILFDDYYKSQVSKRDAVFINICGWLLIVSSLQAPLVFFGSCFAAGITGGMALSSMIVFVLGFGVIVFKSRACAAAALLLYLIKTISNPTGGLIFIIASVLGLIGTVSIQDGWQKYQITAAEERGRQKAERES